MNIRRQFVETLSSILDDDPKLVLLLGDIGVFGFRHAIGNHPQRVVNIGILEQATVSFAAGLAREGFHPVFHSIAPFVVERAYEQLKVDFGYQRLGGNFVSVGSSFDYAALGCSHHCPGDIGALQSIPGMQLVTPGNAAEFDSLFRQAYNNDSPTYFRLSEHSHSQELKVEFGKAVTVRTGSKATLVVAGQLLEYALEATEGMDVTLLYYHTIEPFDTDTLKSHANKRVIAVEPFYEGTLAGNITKALPDTAIQLTSIGVPRQFLTNYGNLDEHEEACGFKPTPLRERIQSILDA